MKMGEIWGYVTDRFYTEDDFTPIIPFAYASEEDREVESFPADSCGDAVVETWRGKPVQRNSRLLDSD